MHFFGLIILEEERKIIHAPLIVLEQHVSMFVLCKHLFFYLYYLNATANENECLQSHNDNCTNANFRALIFQNNQSISLISLVFNSCNKFHALLHFHSNCLYCYIKSPDHSCNKGSEQCINICLRK